MDGALKPWKDLPSFQQSWISYFVGPGTSSTVCFPLEGLSPPLQDPLAASFSSAQDCVLAQDQQEAEEGQKEGSLEVWTCWCLGG